MDAGSRSPRLVAIDVECGGQSRLAVLLKLADQLAVGPMKDATESKYPESKHVSASLMAKALVQWIPVNIPAVATDSGWA
jgi:hypothetical protein